MECQGKVGCVGRHATEQIIYCKCKTRAAPLQASGKLPCDRLPHSPIAIATRSPYQPWHRQRRRLRQTGVYIELVLKSAKQGQRNSKIAAGASAGAAQYGY